MTDDDIKKLIEDTAEATAKKTVRNLKNMGKLKRVFGNSYRKTEKLLYLYPKLPEGHTERIRVDNALTAIEDSDYKDVVASKYFDGLTFEEIAEIYDCTVQNITKNRNKLVERLAAELFPEDVAAELFPEDEARE